MKCDLHGIMWLKGDECLHCALGYPPVEGAHVGADAIHPEAPGGLFDHAGMD